MCFLTSDFVPNKACYCTSCDFVTKQLLYEQCPTSEIKAILLPQSIQHNKVSEFGSIAYTYGAGPMPKRSKCQIPGVQKVGGL